MATSCPWSPRESAERASPWSSLERAPTTVAPCRRTPAAVADVCLPCGLLLRSPPPSSFASRRGGSSSSRRRVAAESSYSLVRLPIARSRAVGCAIARLAAPGVGGVQSPFVIASREPGVVGIGVGVARRRRARRPSAVRRAAASSAAGASASPSPPSAAVPRSSGVGGRRPSAVAEPAPSASPEPPPGSDAFTRIRRSRRCSFECSVSREDAVVRTMGGPDHGAHAVQ